MGGYIRRIIAFLVSFLLLLSTPAIAAPSGNGTTGESKAICQQLRYSQVDLFDFRFSLPSPYRELRASGADSSEIHFLTSEDEDGNYAIIGMAAQSAKVLGISDENPEVILEDIAVAFASQNIDEPEKATAEFLKPAYHPETGLYSARLFVATAYGVEMTTYIVLNPASGSVGVLSAFTKTNPSECILHQLENVSLQRLS